MSNKKNYTLIDHDLKLHQALQHIRSSDFLSFDTETTGLNVRKDKVIGFSFCGKIGTSYYYPLFKWDTANQKLVEVMSLENGLMLLSELSLKGLLMWNASFDIRITRNNLGIDLLESLVADVMLMKHTLAEEGDFSLKGCAVIYQSRLGMDMETAANQEQIELKENIIKNGGSVTKDNYELYKADLDVIARYANADADLTLKLATLFIADIEDEGMEEFFYDEEVMPLYRDVTIKLEDSPIKLDLPLIQSTKINIEKDLIDLENKIINALFSTKEGDSWLKSKCEESFPIKNSGNFAQKVAQFYDLPLPRGANGKFSMSKKELEKLRDSDAKEFLINGSTSFIKNNIDEIRKSLWLDIQGGKLINISSKHQMGDLVFNHMGIKPLSKTKKGNPQFDDTMLQHVADKGHEWAILLGDYNKLTKIKGTYIDRFLDNHEDGYFYFYYKQHGTISGRYGSDAQQLPRVKEDGELSPMVLEYSNLVRSFFIADQGRIFIDCDYESLEPHTFAHVSNEDLLRDIFRKGHDFYSTIAIQTEKLNKVSPDKKAENYLGKIDKPRRQSAKAYSLGIPYGMTPYALSKALDISLKEAEVLYNGYLDGFPNLKQWMEDSKLQAQAMGYIKTETGRIRHLPKVKELYSRHEDKLLDWKYRKSIEKRFGKEYVQTMYRDYKNGVNNARNFQIQGLAASIVNRAAIACNREFIRKGINAWVCAQIHDQLIFDCPIDKVEECKKIIQYCMENTTKLSLQLKAPPSVATNWKESH